MNKDASLSTQEREALKELKEALSLRFALLDFRLFGSKARGESHPDSDIDVMLVVEEATPEIKKDLHDIVYGIILKYDSLISPVLYSLHDIEEGPLSESPLYKTVMKEGIPI